MTGKPTVPDGGQLQDGKATVPNAGEHEDKRHSSTPGGAKEEAMRRPAVPRNGGPPTGQPPAGQPPAGPEGWAHEAAARAKHPPAPDVGSVVSDRYRLLDRIGSGGMGAVFLAEHVAISKKVALKVLDRRLLKEATALPRFLREAKAASQIGHRNVVDVTDYGEVEGGGAWFAMEYLPGQNLKQVLAEHKRLPWDRVKAIARQILDGIGAAHALDIVHRDMKPENCFLVEHEGSSDRVKVLDFGIAKVLHTDGSGNSIITETGIVMGTPRYMSPEQSRGEHPDHRSDLYSLGIVMYELLTGAPPFTDRSWMMVLQAHARRPPVPPREAAPDAEIPELAERIVLKALAKDRTERFQTAQEFIDALDTSEQPVAERSTPGESLAAAAQSAVAGQSDRYFMGMATGAAVTVAVAAMIGAAVFFLLK